MSTFDFNWSGIIIYRVLFKNRKTTQPIYSFTCTKYTGLMVFSAPELHCRRCRIRKGIVSICLHVRHQYIALANRNQSRKTFCPWTTHSRVTLWSKINEIVQTETEVSFWCFDRVILIFPILRVCRVDIWRLTVWFF